MKERQRWTPEEDSILQAYVRQYGPREWNLVSQRMNVPLNRDAKSCLERWKNYLKPGIKKGSLTEEEQCLVVRLQAKHGNKWKRIAAEVPGRTAKRLGKWWEVFKEKQQRELRENRKSIPSPIEQSKYDWLLENFAEKLVKERHVAPLLMATPLLPPWLPNSNISHGPSSPSVTLSLSSSTVPPAMPWLQMERGTDNGFLLASSQQNMVPVPAIVTQVDGQTLSEIVECCRDIEEGHRAWMNHKKESAWRLKRMELQLECEKASKRRDKMEEFESKMRALREEQQLALEKIEAEYMEQMSGLRRDAEAKELKMAEQWATKHTRLTKFLEQAGCHRWPAPEIGG